MIRDMQDSRLFPVIIPAYEILVGMAGHGGRGNRDVLYWKCPHLRNSPFYNRFPVAMGKRDTSLCRDPSPHAHPEGTTDWVLSLTGTAGFGLPEKGLGTLVHDCKAGRRDFQPGFIRVKGSQIGVSTGANMFSTSPTITVALPSSFSCIRKGH